MNAAILMQMTQGRRVTWLAVIIVIQSVCAVFFAADVVADITGQGDETGLHLNLETIATLALIDGVILTMAELRRMLHRISQMDQGLRAARGNMATLIRDFFDRWGLTASEREVALLILKGFDNDAIAALRGVAPDTVRAQSAHIYAKSGTDGRAQLFSVFMEELLADPA